MWSISSPPSPKSRRRSVAGRLVGALVAGILLTLLLAGHVLAAGPPSQTYYVPVPEDQALAALQTLYPGHEICGDTPTGNESPAAPVYTYLSISVIADGTVVTYDHWEDGFEPDPANPAQATTQVWGDGDASNGAPPDIPGDVLQGGAVIVLQSPVDPASRQSVVDFDGGDKITATRAIAVTRSAWATGPDTRLAGALEVYPLDKWGVHYAAPVGEDPALNSSVNNLFTYAALAIMAGSDNTTVTVDPDADGAPDPPVVLDEGESLLVEGVLTGATVDASAPVQVALITGERCENYESRWLTLFPSELWSDSYYNPVGKMPDASAVMTETTVFLHNPSLTEPLTVQHENVAGAQPAVSIPAGAVISVTMPVDSGAHFFTDDGSPFQAIVAVDTGNDRNMDSDWGFALTPERLLTRQTLIGWGTGRDPTSPLNPGENGSPIWVMPVLDAGVNGPVNICVDFNGDNAPGLDDGNGFYYDVLLTLDEFESARVFDPDGDQTGALLYVCDPASGQPPSAKLAAAWGQAPGVATPGEPGLDLGTAAPPAAAFAAEKTAALATDDDGDGLAGPGDTLLYAVTIQNTSRVTVEQVILSDTLPLGVTYVISTTEFDDGSGPAPLPDDASGTPFPLDEDGALLGDLPVNGVFTVTFQAMIDDPYLGETGRVKNTGFVTALGETVTVEAETPLNVLALEKATNGFDADNPPGPILIPGDPVTWTYAVSVTGQVTVANVVVTDSVSGVTPVYVSGDSNGNSLLEPGEQWLFQAVGVAVEGQYANLGMATGVTTLGDSVQASDPSHYFGQGEFFLYFPIIFSYTPPEPCPPPDGCPLEGRIKGMDVHEDTGALYVAARNVNGTADQLLKVDTFTFEIVARADTGAQPWGVVVNETTNRVYVSNYDSGDVRIYDADTLAPLGDPIPVGANPGRMAILEALDTVFVVVRGDSKIAVIRGLGPATLIDASGSGPWGIAADPVRNYVYVSHTDSVSFSLLRNLNGAWISQPGTGKLEDHTRLFGLAYNASSGKLYAPYADKDGNWFVDIWEPHAFSPWGRVTHTPVPSGGALNDPDVGGDGVVVNPVTGNVFNANTGADSVSVIDGGSNAALATIPVLDDPFPAAVDGKRNMVYIGLRAPGRVVRIEDAY